MRLETVWTLSPRAKGKASPNISFTGKNRGVAVVVDRHDDEAEIAVEPETATVAAAAGETVDGIEAAAGAPVGGDHAGTEVTAEGGIEAIVEADDKCQGLIECDCETKKRKPNSVPSPRVLCAFNLLSAEYICPILLYVEFVELAFENFRLCLAYLVAFHCIRM